MSIVDSTIQAAEGVGKLLRNIQRTINAQTVQIQGIFEDEPGYDTYVVSATGVALSVANNDHLLQIMGGATRRSILRRLTVWQLGLATAAAIDEFQLVRLTTAGTGGTAKTPMPLDPTDAAVGFTAMTLPTAKGTENATVLFDRTAALTQAVLATAVQGAEPTKLCDFDFTKTRQKGLFITNAPASGIALKHPILRAGATVTIEAIVSEINW